MIQEIEVEGVGTMRQLNDYQLARLRVIRGPNRNIAPMAFGLGMTIQQFKQLQPEQRKAAWEAYGKLISPYATLPTDEDAPRQKPLPQRYQRVSEERMVQMGRELLEIKKSLPHGHFGPWVRDKSGITMTQAQRFMKAAKGQGQRK